MVSLSDYFLAPQMKRPTIAMIKTIGGAQKIKKSCMKSLTFLLLILETWMELPNRLISLIVLARYTIFIFSIKLF